MADILHAKTKIIDGDLYKFFVDDSNFIHEVYRYDDCKSSRCEGVARSELGRNALRFAEENFSGWWEDIRPEPSEPPNPPSKGVSLE